MTRKDALAETTRQLGNARDTLKTSKNKAVLKATANKIDYLIAVESALRGLTREMVEKMFPGCPGCDSVTSKWEIKFCPFCGRPRTDEAVDMMLERWKEALEDG